VPEKEGVIEKELVGNYEHGNKCQTGDDSQSVVIEDQVESCGVPNG